MMRTQHLKVTESSTLRELLGAALPIDHLLEFGAIYHNGLRVRENITLLEGDTLRIHTEPKRFLTSGAQWKPAVLYEDEDFLAIDKPGGLPTHPTLDNFIENAKTLCERHFERELYVTHRLDIPTVGVLIFAKTPAALSGFNKLLRKRRVTKIYRAECDHAVSEGSYVHYLNPQSKTPKEVSDEPHAGWLECKMKVKHLDESGMRLEIELETGRTHQIRAQLAKLGAPILGDLSYGSKNTLPRTEKFVQERIALECYNLSFSFRSRTLGISRPSALVTPHHSSFGKN